MCSSILYATCTVLSRPDGDLHLVDLSFFSSLVLVTILLMRIDEKNVAGVAVLLPDR